VRASLRRWLAAPSFTNPIEQGQAPIVQVMLLGIFVTAILVFPICYSVGGTALGTLITSAADGIVILTTPIALVAFRRGAFRGAIALEGAACLAAIALFLVPLGLHQSWALLAFPVPITLLGLLGSRRGLWLALGTSSAVVLVIAIFELQSSPWVGFAPAVGDSALIIVGFYVLIMTLVGLFLDRFGTALRVALSEALAREQELERLRARLETLVAERTQALQATIDQLQTSQATIRELGAPILPVTDGVLVAPLIGVLDHDRITVLTAKLLEAVQQQRTHTVILDITGVPVMDAPVTQAILQVSMAVRLLGATVSIVGIRAEVAMAILHLGMDLQGVATFSDLHAALR
jgi:anti-anti-sigma regulatory factor